LRRKDSSAVIEFKLGNGAALLMAGYTQKFWQHGVPARKRVPGARINLTFRNVVSKEPAR